ncbi:hypothetical protein NLG97_g9910 [Lecanicillium saksenae]|uniref:Uncharacterized protein n=1 Tax=Lecanicillium saksenae TaxID=468837 RepID=A0ACC1QIM3_9HYPO|nr:hypothetical protein NLG97_g9910 [Lecanicillium saksenae]
MAPKPVFKVHSLSKHIEETTKGLNADARGKKPAAARPSIKKTRRDACAGIFANNDSDSDSSSSSSDDSDSDDNGPTFLKDLTKSTGTKRRSKDDEIADSDVERTAAASKAKPVKKAAAAPAKAKAASSSNDSSSESESESSDEEVSGNGAALKSKASSTSATSPTSSSGSDSGSSSAASSSDEESESEGESESEAAPATPAPVVKKPVSKPAPAKPAESESEDSSSEESESESEEAEPAAKPQKKPAAKGAKAALKPTKPASDSSSEDESEEESSDGESSEEEADESMQVVERAQAGQVTLPQFMHPDFELRKGDQQSNGQDVARVCSEANLQGKQLWYFTLPANVPVSVVENVEFPMDRSQQSGRILSHNGEDYGISYDSMAPTKSIQILIPSADGSKYKPTNRAVDEIMQIRRITQVGATTATPAAIGSSTKAPRPQPKGLKARFQPIGVNSDMGTLGPDEDSDDDAEMQDAPIGSTPKTSQKKDKKRKDASDPRESASKSKKSKRKHSISEDEDAAAAEQLLEESVIGAHAEADSCGAARDPRRRHARQEEQEGGG